MPRKKKPKKILGRDPSCKATFFDKFALMDKYDLDSCVLACLSEAIASCRIEGVRWNDTLGEWDSLLTSIAGEKG